MRTALVLCSFLLAGFFAGAQTTITPQEAAAHIGKTVTVCGKIFGGKYFEYSKNKLTLLNMGAAYPDAPLTIVIDSDNRKNFAKAPEEFYKDKEVCITGTVTEYKGKPQIVITKEADITLKKP
jgi:micrococcal nuclease